ASKRTDSEMLLHIVAGPEHRIFNVDFDRVFAGDEAFQRNRHTERVAIAHSGQLCRLLLLEWELHRCAALCSLAFDIDGHANLRSGISKLDEVPQIAFRREKRVALRNDFQGAEHEGLRRTKRSAQRVYGSR